MDKFIIIGLGNPGEQYKNTRHNAGKMFMRWARSAQVQDSTKMREKVQKGELKFIESESFMNESGEWVKRKLKSYGLWVMGVVHDDLDLPFGHFKIQFGKGPRGHKGILSIEEALGTKNFWRVRIGIDARKTTEMKRPYQTVVRSQSTVDGLSSGSDYVLSNFSREEQKRLEEEVFPKIEESVLGLIQSQKSKVSAKGGSAFG